MGVNSRMRTTISSFGRRIADTLSLRVLIFVLLGFGAVAVPAYFAFNWVINSTVIQLGTLFAEKQVLYDRHRGLGALVREVSLAETLAGSQAIRDWALDEDNPVLARRGIAVLPRTLEEAVAAFKADPLSEKVFGAEMFKSWTEFKEQEWLSYLNHVSDWEMQRYLRFF